MYQIQLTPGDEFVVWTRPPGAEPLQVAVGGESGYRPFPERALWVLDAAAASALLERARGGGSAADDEP